MALVCGVYYIVQSHRQWLPQLEVDAHASVVGATSRTTLTQRFVNPGLTPIDEVRYVFPLYDGVAVVGFTCTVGARVITGVVKRRDEAKHDYDAAKRRGETAGLFEQSFEAGDVFTTSLGNIGAKEEVKVEVTFIGELKHDAEVDGVRYMLPSCISPRYGDAPSLDGTTVATKGISFTLDAEVPDGSAITAIRSPSHPIAVSVGTTSTASDAEPSLRRASATLSLGSVELGNDIIIQIVASRASEPSAVVEHHPTLDSQALMVTLVPKFSLPAEKPEIVFLCDRSGSMSGPSITDAKQALRIFLKSLPVGVKFNICSFGSNHSFLWPKSKTYDQHSLAEASAHIETFEANYGGTEMYRPMEATIKQRFKDMNLELFLLTDGEIWNQDALFDLINKEVAASRGAIRVFTLGIGIGASSSLIEGVARAGNGFSQTTAPGEKMDKKVIRMLKGSLFPHIRDYTLEVKYGTQALSDDDDFELVEKVSDSLTITEAPKYTKRGASVSEKPDPASARSPSPVKKIISLFQRDLQDIDNTKNDLKDRFDALPAIEVPHYLQTPAQLPALYPFNRTTAYVIITGRSAVPKSVVLKGTCAAGPLELEIPVTPLDRPGSTIHQLAARREAKELEEGRGWLMLAKNSKGKLLKDTRESQFSDMVEREAVRLGTTYQVAGKWTSFVAVQQGEGDTPRVELGHTNPEGQVDTPFILPTFCSAPVTRSSTGSAPMLFGSTGGLPKAKKSSMSRSLFSSYSSGPPAPPQPPPCPASANPFGRVLPAQHQPRGGSLFGSAPQARLRMSSGGGGVAFGSSPPGAVASYGSAPPVSATGPMADVQCFGAALPDEDSEDGAWSSAELSLQPAGGVFGAPTPSASSCGVVSDDINRIVERGERYSFGTPVVPPPPVPVDPLQALTVLQSFIGSWSWNVPLVGVLGLDAGKAAGLPGLPAAAATNGGNNDVLATACAVAFFRRRLAGDKDTWEMMVDKAEEWLAKQVGGVAAAAALVQAAEGLI